MLRWVNLARLTPVSDETPRHDEDFDELDPEKLSWLERLLAGAFGLASSAAGAWAVIASGRDGAGAVGLTTVGFVGLALAIIGEKPSTFYYKHLKIRLRRRAKRAEAAEKKLESDVAQALEELPIEGDLAAEIRKWLVHNVSADNRVSDLALRVQHLETRTAQVVKLIDPKFKVTSPMDEANAAGAVGVFRPWPWDFCFTTPQGKRVYLVTRLRVLPAKDIDNLVGRAREAGNSIVRVILVTEEINYTVHSASPEATEWKRVPYPISRSKIERAIEQLTDAD